MNEMHLKMVYLQIAFVCLMAMIVLSMGADEEGTDSGAVDSQLPEGGHRKVGGGGQRYS